MKFKNLLLKTSTSLLTLGVSFAPLTSCSQHTDPKPTPTQKFTVSFVAFGPGSILGKTVIQVEEGTKWADVPKPIVQPEENYVFAGYLTPAQGTYVLIKGTDKVLSNLEVIAYFALNGNIGINTPEKKQWTVEKINQATGVMKINIDGFSIDDAKGPIDWTRLEVNFGQTPDPTKIGFNSAAIIPDDIEDKNNRNFNVEIWATAKQEGSYDVSGSLSFYNDFIFTIPFVWNFDLQYKFIHFQWNKFVDPDGDPKTNNQSNWKYLSDSLKDGLDSEAIKDAIKESTLDRKDFDWANEYVAYATLNSQIHRVRLIGLDQPKYGIRMTWEFMDVISDKNKQALKTCWNPEDYKHWNENYFTSNVNDALNNTREFTNWSNSDIKLCVYSMLQNDLQDAIITVKRNVNVKENGIWTHDNSKNVKLFLPTLANYYPESELAQMNPLYCGEGYTQYPFYQAREMSFKYPNDNLFKYSLDGVDCEYWLSSPDLAEGSTKVWYSSKGQCITAFSDAGIDLSVAPCFCL